MKRLSRFRLSPAMVVACIALTVALGGTSIAAIEALPRNSVGAKQLKRNAVTGVKVKANAITSPKVANNSLTGADINEARLGTVPSATNATNATTANTAGSAAPSGAAGGDLAGTYPAPTIGAGKVTPAKFGAIPQARVEKTAAQSIPSNIAVFNTLTYEAELYDTAGLFDPAFPGRLTAPIAGVYVIDAGVRWAANALGTRFAGICINQPTVGACGLTNNVAVSQYATNDDPGVGTLRLTQQSVSTQLKLAAGDVVQVVVTQNSGGALNVDGFPVTHLAMTWVGPG
jgi:hypothetical protein